MVSFEIAKKLKEKKYDEYCDNGYFLKDGLEYLLPFNDHVFTTIKGQRIFDIGFCTFEGEFNNETDIVKAPKITDILSWLRKKYKIYVVIHPLYIDDKEVFEVTIHNRKRFNKPLVVGYYDSWDVAEEKGTEYVINNVI